MGKGFVATVGDWATKQFERLTKTKLPPVPAPEPENAKLLVKGVPGPDPRKKFVTINFYRLPGEPVPRDEFNYWVMYYTEQVNVISQKIQAQELGKGKYEEEIEKIEDRIKEREQQYIEMIAESQRRGVGSETAREQYEEGLRHGWYEPGDIEETMRRAELDSARKSDVSLPDKDTFVYGDNLADITDPTAIVRHYADIRTLIGKYRGLSRGYDREIQKLEKRRDANQAYLDYNMARFQAYYQ